MRARLLSLLAAVATAVGLVLIPAGQATVVASMIACPRDYPGALKYHYYSASGTETTSAGQYSVHAAVTVRDPDQCGTELINQADGAARGYDDGNPAVGNVQVDSVALYACPASPCLRAGPSGQSNSNGGPTTELIYTVPTICVSPFGSGAYSTAVWFTWRYNGNLIRTAPYSNWTSSDYATIPC